jgi:hypothetical protein
MTFIITMIGDSFPLLSSQTAFLDTLQERSLHLRPPLAQRRPARVPACAQVNEHTRAHYADALRAHALAPQCLHMRR